MACHTGMLCLFIRIALMRQFWWEHTTYLHIKETHRDIPIMPSILALCLTIISSKYPCLEDLFMIPKMFEPLKFYLYGNAGTRPYAFLYECTCTYGRRMCKYKWSPMTLTNNARKNNTRKQALVSYKNCFIKTKRWNFKLHSAKVKKKYNAHARGFYAQDIDILCKSKSSTNIPEPVKTTS